MSNGMQGAINQRINSSNSMQTANIHFHSSWHCQVLVLHAVN